MKIFLAIAFIFSLQFLPISSFFKSESINNFDSTLRQLQNTVSTTMMDTPGATKPSHYKSPVADRF
jgi:hypothetical protein